MSNKKPDELTPNTSFKLTNLPHEPDELTPNNEYQNRHLCTKTSLLGGVYPQNTILILLF
jgi:hypothetical protein